MKSSGIEARYLCAVSAILLFAAACSGPGASHELILAGSTSIQPFADMWAERFMQLNPDVVINVQGGGSSAGIQACRSSVCQVGMSSRELKPEEKDLMEFVVARDGLAVIVHPSNPVGNLRLDEVRLVFAGLVRSWRFLGGPDREITVVTREEGSGTRGAFQEMVMQKTRIFNGAITQDSNGTVREIVARDPYSIGFISLGLVDDRVKTVALEGVKPSEAAILDGSYKLVRPFLFLTKSEPEGLVKRFMDFVLSAEGQALVKEEGLIPAR